MMILKKMWIYILAFILVFSSVVAGLGIIASGKKGLNLRGDTEGFEDLPVVGTLDNLKKLIKEYDITNRGMYSMDLVNFGSGPNLTSKKAEASVPVSGNADYSATNLQVQGVDEADIIKTDGKYIYQVNRYRVLIVKAYPASEMEVEDMLEFDDKNFAPMELFLDEKYLVVLGHTAVETRTKYSKGSGEDNSQQPPLLPSQTKYFLKALVYDVSDMSNIKLKRSVEIEGYYLSSRKIGNNLYLITNKGIDYWYMNSKDLDLDPDFITPSYRDSATAGDYVSLDYSKIKYFPGVVQPNFMIITAFNIEDMDREASVSAYLGSGQNIYVSQNNLYAAAVTYDQEIQIKRDIRDNTNVPPIIHMPAYKENTIIYKLSLEDGEVLYSGKGEVPGRVLNQFSMDEYKGQFRIATTKGSLWATGENISNNNLFVLDDNMKISGKIENIAPGEKIYSVRFMGDRGYMVTFRKVDPLFVMDLKDPKNPKILGALKIPGYSDYLQPYDENHIIGFGKDAEEAYSNEGRPGGFAYYQGMKIALFDVSDVASPIEKFSIKIGDRGTDSEVLHNHKALLFSKEKGIISFPITVFEIKNHQQNTPNQYGEFSFQGAYVYGIDMESGFVLKGRITHLTGEDYIKSGQYWYDSDKNIERIIYIGDTLYTISGSMIKAHGMSDLKLKGQVQIQ